MNRVIVAASVLAAVAVPVSAAAALNVVTTTEDLASIAREVGGEKVKVESLSRGYQDPHYVEPKPSFILRLHNADLLIVVGRELELGWLPPLLTQARNPKIQPGGSGYLDASQNAKVLDIPTGQITRAMGDVHPLGNPHYWLDPENGRRIAKSIQAKLSALAPADAAFFAERAAAFDKKLADAEKRWDALMAPYKGLQVVTYHNSWPNFAQRFGLVVTGFVEPKPGIPPSPAHILELIKDMKAKGVKVILVEPYFDMKTPSSIARETGARVVEMTPSTGGEKGVDDYLALFDHDLKLLTDAAREAGAK
jgi:zinc/manganese transport system substrate-binding protein